MVKELVTLANCILLSGGTWNPENWPKVKRYLGPYRVATALEQAGYSTFVLDYIEEFTKEELAQTILKHIGPDTLWVGFSSSFFWVKQDKRNNANTAQDDVDNMYYTKYEDVKYVLNLIKFMAPKAKLIYGGSKAPYFALNDVDKNIDYYVTGNADNSIIDITDYLAGKQDSITHLDGKIIDSFKYPEPVMTNLKTDWSKQAVIPGEALPLELARGCIFKCKFCDYPLTGKKKGTYLRDPVQIKDELISNWEIHGTQSYFLTDDTFNDDNDKLDMLAKVFSDLPFKISFSTFLRLDLIDKHPHQAKLLMDMGLVGNFFGIESLQQQSATAIGKGLRPNKVKDRLYWLKDQWGGNVNMEAGFILGLPYDTEQYFEELISWCIEKDNPLDSIHFYPLMLFHYKDNVELHKYASEFALNPEIYGYEMKNTCKWELPSQNLNYDKCLQYSHKFNDLRNPMNKIAGFAVSTALNTGISLEDIRTMSQSDIEVKYDIPSMNKVKFKEYKRLVGL